MKILIYALYDSRNPAGARYVGSTKDIKQRLYGHTCDPAGPAYSWARDVMDEGGSIRYHVLQVTVPHLAIKQERRWYDWLCKQGHLLLNRQRPRNKNHWNR